MEDCDWKNKQHNLDLNTQATGIFASKKQNPKCRQTLSRLSGLMFSLKWSIKTSNFQRLRYCAKVSVQLEGDGLTN